MEHKRHLRMIYSNTIQAEEASCQAEFRRLMSERHTRWLPCLKEAQAELSSASEAEIIALADQKAIERWIVPPHWRAFVWCESCGPMPVFGQHKKELPKVQNCPWCWTDAGNFYRDNPELAPKPSPSLKNAI